MFLKHFLKHGERHQMWLNKLKIAIVEKNVEVLNLLLENMPTTLNLQEIEEAYYLLEEAKSFVTLLKDETAYSMQQIKKNLQFLRSTDIPTSRDLDVMS